MQKHKKPGTRSLNYIQSRDSHTFNITK